MGVCVCVCVLSCLHTSALVLSVVCVCCVALDELSNATQHVLTNKRLQRKTEADRRQDGTRRGHEECVCVCVWVCVRARARVCVCVCDWVDPVCDWVDPVWVSVTE